MLYPMNVLVDLDASDPRTNADWLLKRQLLIFYVVSLMCITLS